MPDGNVILGTGRCHGVEIKGLTTGHTITVYGAQESQREGPTIFATVAIGGDYRDAVEAAVDLVRECLFQAPPETE